jgi:hypothetical protein
MLFFINGSRYTHISINCPEHVIHNSVFYIHHKITLKFILQNALQSIVGVALLRHSRLHPLTVTVHPYIYCLFSQRSHTLCRSCSFHFLRTNSENRNHERYAVGRRRRFAPPLPTACANIHCMSLLSVLISPKIADLSGTMLFVHYEHSPNSHDNRDEPCSYGLQRDS